MSNQTLSPKEQRMAEAARLRYQEGKKTSEIASDINVRPQTVRNYFSEDKMEQLKRKFSDQEKYKLQRAIEQDLWDAEQNAKESLSRAKQLADSSKEYRQVAESLLKVRKEKVKLLQELGIIQKPKERKQVENKGGQEIVFNEKTVTKDDKQEESEEEEVEADASE